MRSQLSDRPLASQASAPLRRRWRRYSCSGASNPCPICGRTKDADCRWGDGWIACHSGASANDLKPGDTLQAFGATWYLSRTSGGHSGVAHIYRLHRPGQRLDLRHRSNTDPELLAQVWACRKFYALLRPRVHAALRLPAWEFCSPVELRLVAETTTAVEQLIHHLEQARRIDVGLQFLLPIADHWIKALAYHQADLQRFQRDHLGMVEGWR